MDSFYVVLPSNTPFLGNRTSQFTVKLPNIIDLSDGNWTVSLSSIIYPNTFSGIEEELKLTIHFKKDPPQTLILPQKFEPSSIKNLENFLNDEVMKNYYNSTMLTALPALTSSSSKTKRERKKRQTKEQINEMIDAENRLSYLENSYKMAVRILPQIDDAMHAINKLASEIEDKLIFLKINDISRDIEAKELQHLIINNYSEFLGLKEKADYDANEANKLKDLLEKAYVDKNYEQTRTYSNQIKDIKKEVLGDTEAKGYLEKMQDLKNQIIVDNVKWTNLEENKTVNRLYLKARTFEKDIIKVYNSINITHDYTSKIINRLTDLTINDCHKKRIKNEITNKASILMNKLEEIKIVNEMATAKMSEFRNALKEKDVDRMANLTKDLELYYKKIKGNEEGKESILEHVQSIYNSIVPLYNEIVDTEQESSTINQEGKAEKGACPIEEVVVERDPEPVNPEPVNPEPERDPEPVKPKSITTENISKSEQIVDYTRHDNEEKADEWSVPDSIIARLSTQNTVTKQRKSEIMELILSKIKRDVKITDSNEDTKRNDNQPLYLHYDDEQMQRFYLWVNKELDVTGVEMSKQLAFILGFELDELGFVEMNSFAKYNPDIEPLHSMYIYAPNLIANTVIGNTQGPLLRIVNITASSVHGPNRVVENIYSQEFHHEVLQRHISEIKIEIRSDTGRLIEFNSGNCILTLHFKQSFF